MQDLRTTYKQRVVCGNVQCLSQPMPIFGSNSRSMFPWEKNNIKIYDSLIIVRNYQYKPKKLIFCIHIILIKEYNNGEKTG